MHGHSVSGSESKTKVTQNYFLTAVLSLLVCCKPLLIFSSFYTAGARLLPHHCVHKGGGV
jgi:hypothetical protein